MELSEKVAVITGGASGIGRATALALARLGNDVVLVDVHEERLAAAEAEIAALGRRALAVRCDVSRDDDMERLAKVALGEFGQVDILMNNAGVILRGLLEEIPMAAWEWVLDINLLGVIRGIRAFLPHMLIRGSGYIINTGSMAGIIALTGEGAPYVTSKFAVVGLSEALALYARPKGIGVSVLCPGSVDTNLPENVRIVGIENPERIAAETAQAQSVQGGDLMTPDEVARHVIDGLLQERFFILPDSQHQTLIEERAKDLNAFLEARLRQTLTGESF